MKLKDLENENKIMREEIQELQTQIDDLNDIVVVKDEMYEDLSKQLKEKERNMTQEI